MADGSSSIPRVAPHNQHDAIMHHLVSALTLMGYEVQATASRVTIAPGAEKRIRRCQEAVCEAVNIKLPDILSGRRQAAFTRPRHLAMWLAVECTQASYPRLGRAFCRDHTTVLHAIRGFERHRAADPEYAQLAERLRSQLLEEFSR